MYLIQMLTLWEEEYVPVAVASTFDEAVSFVDTLRTEMLRTAPDEPEAGHLSAEQVDKIKTRITAIPHVKDAVLPPLAERVHQKLF